MTTSVTQEVQRYLMQHPSVRDSLLRGLINYSALAREICKTRSSSSFDAAVAACRRYRTRTKESRVQETAVTSLLRRARTRIKNKISVVIIEKPRDFDRIFALQKRVRRDRGSLNFIEGEEAVTLIIESQDLELLKESFAGRIKRITSGLAQITMLFDQRIETTSGVLAHVFALLGANNVNILEEISCWTDMMLIVSEQDAVRAADLLSLQSSS